MKTKTTIILTALVVSMIFSAIPSVMADSRLDSLVNIVTQARAQVKLQLDKTDNIPGDIKTLYEQGNSETELLISSVKQQDVEQAKWHFLSAMKIFKQISMTFSESSQTATKAVTAPQSAQTSQAPTSGDIDYKITINRIEKYTSILKAIAAKNNVPVDFTKLDGLIQNAKTSIINGDVTSVEKIFGDIKTTIIDIQNLIKEQTNRKSVDRAKSFANEYINKIDALITHARELGISDDDVAKLKQVKEELSTTSDPSQIVVKVKRIITINIEMQDSRNQKVLPETNKQTVQTDSLKTEKTLEKSTSTDQNIKQEPKQKETKPQKPLSSIGKLEARLAKLEPNVDDGIKTKFDSAKSMLTKLKNQASNGNVDQKTLKSLDSLIGEIEDYVNSQDTVDDSSDDTQDIPADSGKADTVNQQDSFKSNLKQKRSPDQKDQ